MSSPDSLWPRRFAWSSRPFWSGILYTVGSLFFVAASLVSFVKHAELVVNAIFLVGCLFYCLAALTALINFALFWKNAKPNTNFMPLNEAAVIESGQRGSALGWGYPPLPPIATLIGTIFFAIPTFIYIHVFETAPTWTIIDNLFLQHIYWVAGCACFITSSYMSNYLKVGSIFPSNFSNVSKERWYWANLGFVAGSMIFLMYIVTGLVATEFTPADAGYNGYFFAKAFFSTIGSGWYLVGSYAMLLEASEPPRVVASVGPASELEPLEAQASLLIKQSHGFE